MSTSQQLRETLSSLWDRVTAIKDELTILNGKAENGTVDKSVVMEACHSLRQEMIRLRKRIYEVTEDYLSLPENKTEEFTNTNPGLPADDPEITNPG